VLADKKREWNKPRDDLLCDDLVQFPSSAQVPAVLDPYFGEIVMIVEFLSVFGSQLGLENSFPDGVTIGEISLLHLLPVLLTTRRHVLRFVLEMVEKALFGSDINGPLSDLLCFFLAAIFNCIEEEEMDEEMAEGEGLKGQQEVGKADLLDDTIEPGEMSYKRLIENATSASQISQLTHGKLLRLTTVSGYIADNRPPSSSFFLSTTAPCIDKSYNQLPVYSVLSTNQVRV